MKDKDNSLFIAITGGLTLIVIIALIASDAFRMPANHGGWIYEYQTLIAGLLGSIIAACTAGILWIQRADNLHRKHLSSKAKMLDALVELGNYTTSCFNYITDKKKCIPKAPKEEIQVFKDSIEFLDTQSADAISELVQFYQVHNSRLSKYKHQDRDTDRDYEQRIIDVIRLNYFIIRIFSYARNEDGTPQISINKLTYEDNMQSLKALLNHEYSNGRAKEKYDNCVRIIKNKFSYK